MKGKILQIITSLWRKNESASNKCLIAPSYDDATTVMSEWVEQWGFTDLTLYTGDDAEHGRAVAFLNSHGRQTKLLLFIGHAKPTGLLTRPGIGKTQSAISSETDACLLDTEDLTSNLKNVHIVAWACHAGSYFGPKVATLKGSGFLGFNGSLNITINHEPSEHLWSSMVKELFKRIADKGHVESHDAEWLRHELLKRRRDIKNGVFDTGIHNRFNSMFLKAAAKNAVVHISKG